MAVVDLSLNDLPTRIGIALEGLAIAESDLRCSFDWNNYSGIPCVGEPEKDSKILGPGGWERVRQVRISVRNISLPDPLTPPENGQLLNYFNSGGAVGVQYRVVEVETFWNAWLRLTCQSPYRGS